jgi:hypothetical protein
LFFYIYAANEKTHPFNSELQRNVLSFKVSSGGLNCHKYCSAASNFEVYNSINLYFMPFPAFFKG